MQEKPENPVELDGVCYMGYAATRGYCINQQSFRSTKSGGDVLIDFDNDVQFLGRGE
jgi:hypothetical protein